MDESRKPGWEIDQRLARYVPPRQEWTPADLALYGPPDLFRVPPAEAEDLQLNALRYAFERHYRLNAPYRQLCDERGVTPAQIATPADLTRIPLLPDRFFKDYPDGRDFAVWLGNIVTGDLPRIGIAQKRPTHDQVLAAFNQAGMQVTFSSGTSGRQTFIPRDRRTFLACEYALAKVAASMRPPEVQGEIYGLLFAPNPAKTNLFVGKALEVSYDVMDNVELTIDREISSDMVRMQMSGQRSLKAAVVRSVGRLSGVLMMRRAIRWLDRECRTGHMLSLVGPPFLLHRLFDRLEAEGRSYDLGERASILTAGGWKAHEGRRVTAAEFRRRAQKLLGIPDHLCTDCYGMVESNGYMPDCPEGHYFHIPHSYFKALVVDDGLQPLPFGRAGRFAFLDAIAGSYPGFVVTNDWVTMLEHCPVCDRPGPVLEPEITRVPGSDTRGCSEEMRRMLAGDLRGADLRAGDPGR